MLAQAKIPIASVRMKQRFQEITQLIAFLNIVKVIDGILVLPLHQKDDTFSEKTEFFQDFLIDIEEICSVKCMKG